MGSKKKKFLLKRKVGFQFESLQRDNSLKQQRVIYDVEKNLGPTGEEDDPIMVSDSKDESEHHDTIILSDVDDLPTPLVNSQSGMSNSQADNVDGNIDISRITNDWLYSMEHDGGKEPVSSVVRDYKLIVKDNNNLLTENTGR